MVSKKHSPHGHFRQQKRGNNYDQTIGRWPHLTATKREIAARGEMGKKRADQYHKEHKVVNQVSNVLWKNV